MCVTTSVDHHSAKSGATNISPPANSLTWTGVWNNKLSTELCNRDVNDVCGVLNTAWHFGASKNSVELQKENGKYTIKISTQIYTFVKCGLLLVWVGLQYE